jgi:hypothetical protein
MSELLSQIRSDIKNDRYYQQNFSNDGPRFLAWYLKNCCLRTAIQAKDDITDGPNDKEFDAIIVDDEKRQITIVQSKFYAGSVDHQPLQEVLAAWLQIQNLSALQENCNARLRVKLEAVASALEDDYEVVFELVTTGHLTDGAKDDLAAFQSTISDFEHPESSITLVDEDVIQTRWQEAIGHDLPKINHTLSLENGHYLSMDIANFKTVIAAVPLSECLKLPGISDGKLFRRNVRQSLGLTNKVNKGLKQTLTGDSPQYFFFYHNGITALCEEMSFDEKSVRLTLNGLAIVNGCQSLNTILACSEKVKTADARVLFRFYEIPQRDLADKISIYTNSQSAVKPRDLRSNDKRVLALKKNYESYFPTGYMITKRGEGRPADKDDSKTIDISTLARGLMAWHCQRPNNSSNENKLFDKFFEQLFKADYPPPDIAALKIWTDRIDERWKKGDLGLNESLMSAPSYSKFHLLFAVQACFSTGSNQIDKVPAPSSTLVTSAEPNAIITLAATAFNAALEAAVEDYQDRAKIFSIQNWLKAKDSVLKLLTSVRMSVTLMSSMPGGPELKKALVLPAAQYGLRWVAD